MWRKNRYKFTPKSSTIAYYFAQIYPIMHKVLRTLILIAILIVAYLLVLAWRNDYANPTPVSAPATEFTQAGVPIESTSALTTAATSDRLVSVKTPSHEVQINLDGGDLVHIALPKHAQSQGNDAPFVLMDEASMHYVAQSGTTGQDGFDGHTRAQYASQKNSYVLESGSLTVPLVAVQNGVSVEKRYTFHAEKYPIDLDITINNPTQTPWHGNVYAQLVRDDSGDPSAANRAGVGLVTYLGGAMGVPSDPYQKIKFTKFDEQNIAPLPQGWVGLVQHYFVGALVPDFAATSMTHNAGDLHYIGYKSVPIRVDAGRQITLHNQIYAGPKIQADLQNVAQGLNQTVDYGIFWPISKLLFALLAGIHQVLGNWGWSIVALTVVVKVALMWMASKSYYSMAKMRKLAPQLAKMKEEAGDDRMKMSQDMMRLYKEEGVNPLAGCVPVLLQMPIFLALYWVLVESIELRHAPWILWIYDLSAMDPWFVLPILMGVTMYIQQMLNPQPTDPLQAKMMRILPIIFTGFMLFFPAGLVLYWTVSNVFTIIHQHLVNQKVERLYKAKEGISA